VAEDNEPHSATDVCGSGGAHGNANEFITYADWQATYFTGCNYDDPSGNDQFISVCDPDVREIELPRRREKVYYADGRAILRKTQALKFAQAGMKAYGLFENERVKKAIKDTVPVEPLPVLRLDRPNAYYHLIPWQGEEGVTALTRVDARFGTLLGMRILEKPIKKEMLSRDMAMKHVAGQRFGIAEQLGRIRILPEVACLSPTLVWKPCWESWSPNLPFFQFTIGEYVLYVRVDGQVFTCLTTIGRGT
jgi:hypothetical protein